MICLIFPLLVLSFCSVEAQYGDVRCKCVCSATSQNSTVSSKKIYVQSFHDPRNCKCDNVVDKIVLNTHPHFCDKCDCQWQRRNTMTIKVVVIFIICVVSILVLYMIFLICLDPLLPRRDVPYVEHKNDEARNYSRHLMNIQRHSTSSAAAAAGNIESAADINDDDQGKEFVAGSSSGGVVGGGGSDGGSSSRDGGVFMRMKNKMFGVRDEQARWKETVEDQRRHIYDTHTMLN